MKNKVDLKIFASDDYIEQTAKDQINFLCSLDQFQNMKIRIMPDVHAGSGCVCGFTMSSQNKFDELKLVPNLIGVDIGCGMFTIPLAEKPDIEKLDIAIKKAVPAGQKIYKNINDYMEKYIDPYLFSEGDTNAIEIWKEINDYIKPELHNILDFYKFSENEKQYLYEYILKSLGTLGGGNHFIELEQNDDPSAKIKNYIVIHTGSRKFGNIICQFWQKIASDLLNPFSILKKKELKKEFISKFAQVGLQTKIPEVVKKLDEIFELVDVSKAQKEVACLNSESTKIYLKHCDVAQHYAKLNRKMIMHAIKIEMHKLGADLKIDYNFYPELNIEGPFTTMHNYFDFFTKCLRKSAISALPGEVVIIPLNMKDGSLLCKGLGNPDWNYSAPHGAGRKMSRSQAKKEISLDDFKQTMKDVKSSTICLETIDEAPQAYKDADFIEKSINGKCVEVIGRLKSIYNFKATC